MLQTLVFTHISRPQSRCLVSGRIKNTRIIAGKTFYPKGCCLIAASPGVFYSFSSGNGDGDASGDEALMVSASGDGVARIVDAVGDGDELDWL